MVLSYIKYKNCYDCLKDSIKDKKFWLTVEEVVKKYGFSEEFVRDQIKAGKLDTVEIIVLLWYYLIKEMHQFW